MLKPAWKVLTASGRSLEDPLLGTAVVVLTVALVGVVISEVAAVVGLVTLLAVDGPWGHPLADPAWDPASSLILAFLALTVIGGGIGKVLAIIGTVAEREPFAPANAARIESLGWRVIELAVIGWVAASLEVPVGGTVAGHHVAVELQGGNALAFALVLFVLARVFRHGNRMAQDLEGTV
ncbi:MAG TPA: DUF2975 domain-containing protein [Novosphingobium sp.]|nr:DUF2975 domain-containing protein [Novosphingobium sp.]